MKHLFTLNTYFVKYKWRMLLGILFVALSTYFKILQPQMIREALDLVYYNISTYHIVKGYELGDSLAARVGRILLYFGLIVIALAVIMGIFMYYTRQTIIVVSRLIEYDMREKLFAHYTELDLAFYRSHNTGDLMARITEDVGKVRDYLGPAMLYGLNLLFLFVMVIYTMFSVNVTLSLWVLAPLPILSLSIYFVSDIINRKSTIIQKQLSFINSLAQEIYSGIRVVKSYVQEKPMQDYFEDSCEDYRVKSLGLVKTNALFLPLMMLLIGISTILTIYIGGLQVMKGTVTPGNVAEFVIYVNMLTWPVTSIGWIASIVQQAEASMKRLNEFQDTVPSIHNRAHATQHKIGGEIIFDDVSFIYPNSGIKALQDVSLRIHKGQKVGFVGRTASGKTTIADLLMRMFDVTQGRILIDGIDIRDYDLSDLRSQIGYVPQDNFLFSDTIHNNIAITQLDMQREEVEKYAQYASVYDDVVEFTHGFDTLIGERGVSLSGGQKQRIAIARALIKNPAVVIMDDSLSAVDTETEQKIINYMRTALHEKTVIMITHRVNILADFDYVYVLEDGKVIEHGHHRQLLDIDGAYFKLFEQQQLARD